MSALSHDNSSCPPLDRGWQQQRGLTFRAAEELLDQLECKGIVQRTMVVETDGVCVRWREEYQRLRVE